MNLEKKVAYFIDLGLIEYSDAYNLQVSLLDLRKKGVLPDIIFLAQHPNEINFSKNNLHNEFDNAFLYNSLKSKGITFDPNKDHSKYFEIMGSILNDLSIKVSTTKRGGGATAFSPGQLFVHPVVSLKDLFGYDLAVGDYKNKIDEIMLDVLNSYQIPNLKTVVTGFDPKIKSERRDIWYEKNGVSYKLGAKGIVTSRGVAHNGFVFYVKDNSTTLFDLIKPCGYDNSILKAVSMEQVLDKKISLDEVKERTLNVIKQKLGYEELLPLELSDLKKYNI
jgi:lipoyl(octanoyl) transferase